MRAADPRLPGIDPPLAVRATAVPEAPTPSLPARSLPCAPLLPLSGLRFSAPACDVPPRQPPSPPRSTTPPRGCPAGADPPRAVRAAAALHAYIAREAATGRGENAAGPWGCWWRSDVVSQQDDLDRTNRSWALGRASLGAGEGSIRSRSREIKLGRAADVVEGPRPRHQRETVLSRALLQTAPCVFLCDPARQEGLSGDNSGDGISLCLLEFSKFSCSKALCLIERWGFNCSTP